MAFNPSDHLMTLKGKDYLQVMWRLVWFREDHPDWNIEPVPLEYDAEHAIFKATIYDETGAAKVTGHGSESKRDFGDFFEKAETKAVGRALAMLGYGTQFTALELDEGERIVDSQVDRAKRGSTEAAQAAGRAKLEAIKAKQEDRPHPSQPAAAPPVHGPAGPVSLSDVHRTSSQALDAPKGEGSGGREGIEERPTGGPATEAQKEIIRSEASDGDYMNIMQKYGANLERLSDRGAMRVIKQIRENNAGAAAS